MSKKIDVSLVPAATAGVTDATFTDVLTGLIDPDVALTGTYKYLQFGLAAGVGAVVMNKRHSGSFLNFGGAQ